MILLDRDVESRRIFRPVKLIRSISIFEKLTFFLKKVIFFLILRV